MSQILTNIQPDERLAHRITDAAVFAGLSRNANARVDESIVDPQHPLGCLERDGMLAYPRRPSRKARKASARK
jgi:hypothetical protein